MKKISIKKTLCATAAAVMMMASVTGCGKEEEKTTATTAETTVEAGTASDATDTTEAGTGDVAASEMELPDKFVYDGKFEVQIVGYEYLDSGEDYEYDFLNVYFDLTPLDDRLRNVKTIYWTATQSGTELDLDPNSSLTYDDAEHTSDIWLCIQQGVTFRSMVQFALNKGDTSVVTVGIGEKNGEYEYFDVDPKWDMPDIRHEKFELAKVDAPAYGPGNMPEFTGADYDVKYDLKINGITDYSSVMELDTDQNPVYYTCVGISYTITNHSGKEDSPFMLFSSDNHVFQDGVSLMDTSPGQESVDYGKTQEDLPLYQKIQDGETIDFVEYYMIRTDSPIEVVQRDFKGTVMGDMVFEVEPITEN